MFRIIFLLMLWAHFWCVEKLQGMLLFIWLISSHQKYFAEPLSYLFWNIIQSWTKIFEQDVLIKNIYLY